MTHISVGQKGVQARFDINAQGTIIEFADPSYTKAETILLNTDNNSVHAVVHEGLFLIGQAPDDWVESSKASETVALYAQHHEGPLSLGADLKIMQ